MWSNWLFRSFACKYVDSPENDRHRFALKNKFYLKKICWSNKSPFFFDRIFRWDWDRSKTFPFAQLFIRLIKRTTKWRCSNGLRFSSVVSYQRTDVELFSFLPESICQLNFRWKYPNDFWRRKRKTWANLCALIRFNSVRFAREICRRSVTNVRWSIRLTNYERKNRRKIKPNGFLSSNEENCSN